MDESNLRIVVTTNTLQPGGAERQRVLLANELASRGHTVTLWCLQEYGSLREAVDPGVVLLGPTFNPPINRHYDYIISGTTNTESAAALALKISKGRGTKWAIAIHNPLGPGAPKLKRLSRLVLQMSDTILALTTSHAAAIERDWGIVVDNYVPNRIDLSWSEEARARREAGKPKYDVGFLGRVSIEHKGLDLLVKAMGSSPARSLTLAIAGEGSDDAKLRDLIMEEGIQERVTWLGHQEPQDFLPSIGTLVLFSRYEGQPLTLLEAEAAGVPVLASPWAGADTNNPAVRIVDPKDAYSAGAALADQSTQDVSAKNNMPRRDGVAKMADDYLRCLAETRNTVSTKFRRHASSHGRWPA